MSNMHRIQWFDQQIREGRYPNSNHLAERFEISKRQAQRDIEYLGASLRAPLIYIPKRRGYGYEDKTYVLPLMYITEDEKKILKYLAFRYGQYQYDNAAAVNRVGYLLNRFAEEDQAEIAGFLPVFNADSRRIQDFHLLSQAIKERSVVRILFRYEGADGGEIKPHLLRPFKFLTHYNVDYLAAFCEDQGERRTFQLDRIEQVTVTSRTFDDSESVADHAEPFPSPVRKPFAAKVLLSSPLYGASWNGYPIRNVDGLIYVIEFYDTDSFMQHLLVSEWRRLLAPKWLREKLMNRCQNVLNRFNQED